jgi:two-component system, NarL family, sensor kinase
MEDRRVLRDKSRLEPAIHRRSSLFGFDTANRACSYSELGDVTEALRLRQLCRGLSTEILQAQERERRRIGRDLHDSTLQLLVGVQLNLIRLNQSERGIPGKTLVRECLEAIERVQTELRTLAFMIHPPELEGGIAAALKALAEGLSDRTGLTIETFISRLGEVSLLSQLTLYRLAQEALTNIHRHAKARNVIVRLNATKKRLRLVIEDDGIGFDYKNGNVPAKLGVGIAGMIERVSELGGELRVHHLGHGTSLCATLPRMQRANAV